jgi:hypothetical protein
LALTRAVTIALTFRPEPMPAALSVPPLELPELPELLLVSDVLLLDELPPSALSREVMLLVAELVLLVVVMASLTFR